MVGFIALFLLSLMAFAGLTLVEDVCDCDLTEEIIGAGCLSCLSCLAAMVSVLNF